MNTHDLPPGTPGWIVLAAFIIVGLKYLFQFLSEMSESAARFFGPLGRRWRARGQARQAERAQESSRQLDIVERERDWFEARFNESEADSAKLMDWYLRCDAPFHRDLTIRAAEAGCELPDWVPLSRWQREQGQDGV